MPLLRSLHKDAGQAAGSISTVCLRGCVPGTMRCGEAATVATCQSMRLAASRVPPRPAAVRALGRRSAAAGRAVLAGCCPCTACSAQACLGHPPQLTDCPASPLHLQTSGLLGCPAAWAQLNPPPAWSGARTGLPAWGTAAAGGACQAPEQGGSLPACGGGWWTPGWGAAGARMHRDSAGQGRHTPASACVDPCHKAPHAGTEGQQA